MPPPPMARGLSQRYCTADVAVKGSDISRREDYSRPSLAAGCLKFCSCVGTTSYKRASFISQPPHFGHAL